jgi:hypothetical protein
MAVTSPFISVVDISGFIYLQVHVQSSPSSRWREDTWIPTSAAGWRSRSRQSARTRRSRTSAFYERRGLLEPARTSGGTRLYSEADIIVQRRISDLLDEGLNLAGIRRVLKLEAEVAGLRASVKPRRQRSGGT